MGHGYNSHQHVYLSLIHILFGGGVRIVFPHGGPVHRLALLIRDAFPLTDQILVPGLQVVVETSDVYKRQVVLHKPSLLLLRGILVLEKLIVLENPGTSSVWFYQDLLSVPFLVNNNYHITNSLSCCSVLKHPGTDSIKYANIIYLYASELSSILVYNFTVLLYRIYI